MSTKLGFAAVAIAIGGAIVACGAFTGDTTDTPEDGDAATGGDAVVPPDGATVEATTTDTDGDVVTADAPSPDTRTWRYVFVTSEQRLGSMTADGVLAGGREAGDQWCADLAANAGGDLLGRTWRAWLSTKGQDAKDRLVGSDDKLVFEYRLVNGQVVFAAGTQFGANNPAPVPVNALQVDETGHNPGDSQVWTGTDAHGNVSFDTTTIQPGHTCLDWTTGGLDDGTVGTSTALAGWSERTPRSLCNVPSRVYCFEAP